MKRNYGDLPRYKPMPEDIILKDVYGQWVHTNDGRNLSGRIADDAKCNMWWCKIPLILARKYNSPGGKMGGIFMRTLINELRGVWAHR